MHLIWPWKWAANGRPLSPAPRAPGSFVSKTSPTTRDGDLAAWDRLVESLDVESRGAAPAELLKTLRSSAAVKDLVPPEVRAAGRFAAASHVEREATRAVIRSAYRLGDAALAGLGPGDLVPGGGFREIHPRLHAGAVLTPSWCRRLLAELGRLRTWSAEVGIPPVAPNSMNRYGVMLDDLGLGPAVRWLTREVLRPLATSRYPDLGGADLDDPHAFLVEYREDGDLELDFHVDDSEVTLNLCLGDRFEGGELYFEGLRCEAHLQTGCSPSDSFSYEHVPGRALLHAGKHRHGARPIRNGQRVNLIIWCRSPAVRAMARTGTCPSWCEESRARL